MKKTTSKKPKRRRRTNSSTSFTPTSNNGGSTSSSSSSNNKNNSNNKPLLFRLSEAWNNHRIFHQNRRRRSQNAGDGDIDDTQIDIDTDTERNPNDDEDNDDDNDDDGERIPRRCCKDLKVLRAIIPKVEREYQLVPNYDSVGGGVGGSAGRQQKKREIDPNEIGDLCVFYGTIVTGTFCPHSHHLLFDDGRGGTEILPRVHQLFRHLSSQSIVTNTVQAATEYSNEQRYNAAEKVSRDNDNGSGNNDCTSNRASRKRKPTIADKISFTIAVLLDSIPEQSIQTTILKDIVIFLYDLCIISSSEVLPNNDGAETGLQVMAFTEFIDRNPKLSENQFAVDIGSTSSLSLLQSAVIHVLFLILTLQYQKNNQLEGTPDHDHDLPIGVVRRHDPLVLAELVMDSEIQGALLASLRQIMLEEPPSLNQNNIETPSVHTNILLSLQKKIMAANLLVLLLPDLSIYADRQNATTAPWMELIVISTRATLQHMRVISNLKAVSTTTLTPKVYLAIQRAYDSYSSMLVVLIRDIVLCPPSPYNPPPWTLWSLRSQIVSSLLESVAYLPYIAANRSTPTTQLYTMVLRVLHLTLTPEMSTVTHESASDGKGLGAQMLCFDRMKNRLKEQCVINGIYPHLFRLLEDSCVSSLVISIIARLMEEDRSIMHEWPLLETACCITWKKQEFNPLRNKTHGIVRNDSYAASDDASSGERVQALPMKKSRKLTSSSSPATGFDSVMTTDLQQDLNHSKRKETVRLCSDTSIVTTLSNILDKALVAGMSIIDAADLAGSDRSADQYNFLSSLHSIVTTSVAINITNCCRLIESLLSHEPYTERRNFSEINKILAILWKAGYLIAEYIFIGSRTKSSHNCSSGQFQELLGIIIGIGDQPYSQSSTRSDCDRGDLRRKQLFQSISNCAMEYCARNVLQPLDTNIKNSRTLDRLDDSLHHEITHGVVSRDFDETATGMLSQEQESSLLKRISKRQTYCQKFCCRIRSFFGMPPWQKRCIYPMDCMCGLINRSASNSNYKTTAPFMNNCTESLLEQILSTYQRCVLFASVHPVKEVGDQISIDDRSCYNHTKYRSTLSIFYETMASSSPYSPEIIASSISCFPALLLSIVWQSEYIAKQGTENTTRNTDKGTPNEVRNVENEISCVTQSERQYRNVLKTHLGVIKYKHCFGDYISGVRNVGGNFERILGKLAYDSLNRIIVIYTNLVNFKNIVSHDYLKSGANDSFFHLMELIALLTDGKEKGPFAFPKENNFYQDEQLEEDSSFQECILDLLESMAYTGNIFFDSSHVRRARWEFIRSSCYILEFADLQKLATFTPSRKNTMNDRNNEDNKISASEIIEIETDALESPPMSSHKPIPALIWLLQIPFMDEDILVRRYAAERLGLLLCSRELKIMRALLYEHVDMRDGTTDNPNDVTTIISLFFDTVDDLLYKFCGVAQSQLSCTARMTRIGTHTCTYSGTDGMDTILSRQISAIRVIESLCQNARPEINEKGLTRLIRLWIDNLTRIPREYSFSDNRDDSNIVSIASFQALRYLHECGSFGSKMLKHCELSFLPGVFSEILSRGIIDQKTSFTKGYLSLMHFMHTFLVVIPDYSCMRLRDEFEHIFATLSYVDRVLPTVITGLVIEQDYEALCACTGFRLYLISEFNRLEKQLNFVETKEVVIGETNMQKGFNQTLKLGSAKGLKRQTSLLCVSEQGNLKVLSKVLPRLLLEPQRAPLVFFLRTVLQSEVSLRVLLEQKELTVIEEIIWELGKLEDETENGDDEKEDLPWFERHSSNTILQALKKGALILKGTRNTTETSHSQNVTLQSLEGLALLDSVDSKLEAKTAAETWVRKHFMMLLVTVVTMRWKRGCIDMKIRALQCLRVLVHFLRPPDSPQYITQILTMIDSVMSFKPSSSDPPHTRSQLRFLAIKALTQFVEIVLLHELKVIGENLCKIVVSISPLLEDSVVESDFKHDETNLYFPKAIDEAIKMFQALVEGENGRRLAPYFNDVPFMPTHPRLQHVRDSLKRNGIDFDNLLVTTELSSDTTQNGEIAQGNNSSTCSNTSGRSWKDYDRSPYTVKMHLSLRRRLHTLKKLFNHENDNVRHAVLSQLSDLIYNNRGLFHSLVATESTSNQFLTVEIQSAARGGENMRSLVDGLLKRCILETNETNRLKLATCLGEIGALDPNYMGQDTSTRKVESKGIVNEKNHLITTDDNWMLGNGAPWKCRSVKIHYKLQLVTNYFVISLKAAPTPTDQHKIAFAIQEVLKMLDLDSRQERLTCSNEEHNSSRDMDPKNEMSLWLKEQLKKAGVLNVIEPFWSSLYKQQEASKPTKPPFFRSSKSYYAWVSTWTRFLIERSYASKYSRYKDLFFACRSSIRSEAGLRVIEFLLPILVLDSLCFGTDFDRRTTVAELIGTLSFLDQKEMDMVQLQKAIAAVFMVINTLQLWANSEVEERHNGGTISSAAASRSSRLTSTDSSHWPSDESIAAIEDLVKEIPLSLCAQSASYVGMYAQSLCFLEMEARGNDMETVFEKNSEEKSGISISKHRTLLQMKTVGNIHLNGVDIALAHRLFGKLSDCDSMTAIAQCADKQNIIDLIHERETYGDWNGVLQGCEQASQIGNIFDHTASEECTSSTIEMNKVKLATSYLRALLQLNQLEGTLNQVNGIIATNADHKRRATSNISSLLFPADESASQLLPFAVEASWRLSQWDTLQQLVTNPLVPMRPDNNDRNEFMDIEGEYSILLGKAMLGLHQRNENLVTSALSEARESVMSSLSVAARENYSRAYPFVLKLHCLREIEDASRSLTAPRLDHTTLLKPQESFLALTNFWNWNDRLDSTGTDITASIPIINIRLTLSRLAFELELEASLWLTLGKKARKGGLYNIASNSLAHAQSIYERLQNKTKHKSSEDFQSFISEVRLQSAKIKYSTGESTLALQMIEEDDTQMFLNKNETDLQIHAKKLKDDGTLKQFVRNILQSIEWMVEGGLKSGSEVMARYRLIQKLLPDWERAHFRFAKYIDSIMESRINALSSNMNTKSEDDSCRIEIMRKDISCQKYLLQAMKEYGEAVRLSQKHVFEALPKILTLWFDFTAIEGREKESDALHRNQDKVNQLVATYVRTIPAISYYNVLPQLISRVGHNDKDTVTIVLAILKRVLTKFPSQAMWSLGWLRHSVHPDRRVKGEDIFKCAQKSLRRSEEMKMHDLLESSKGLFKFLIDLAKYQPKRREPKFNVRPWKGAVALKEFVPPIQAALTVSRNVVGRLDSKEAFPPHVPRMRAFSSSVQLMASKARPKKVAVFAIPESSQRIQVEESLSNCSNKPQNGDIGEMHFLVKQEAKGDLRKDARVQDLNNVINRLFANPSGGGCSGRRYHRRLHLRTFSVVCLSEDCGILEWVPNTDSFRNLVGKSYNPQVSHHCSRRRGKRIVNINDLTLRTNFIKCQDMYIKNGNLSKAAKMFEETCLKEYPPLFYWWFIRNFQDPHKWFEARTKFALSAAAWSAVGHVIGLGDRHSENILLDVSNGECVHVDFDCIFDKGLHLPRPEVVPFRLTPNMLDAFGPTGANGAFSGGLVAAMTTLRNNRDILLSVLEPFLKDPVIDWRRHRTQQKEGTNTASFHRETVEAKRSAKIIEGRLKGIYNLRNPNTKKIRRVDGHSFDEDDEMTSILPLSVEGQAHKMITEASSHENLIQLYFGWMPWI